MGASFDYMVTTSYDKNDAEDEFRRAQNMQRDDEAEGYSGNISELGGKIVWRDLRLKDLDAALDVIERTHNKHSPPIAVSFGTLSKGEPTAAEFKRWRASSGFDKFLDEVMKSKMRESRFCDKYISFMFGSSGFTFCLNDFNQYPDLKKRLIDLNAEFLLFLDEAKRKAGGSKMVWAIGGNCPS